MYIREISHKEVLLFLQEVDKYFLVPLSHKQDLEVFVDKLVNKATICAEIENNAICSMVAGYTDDVINNMAYISIVATCPAYQKRGVAIKLIKEFLTVASSKGLTSVHLYSDSRNKGAIHMYEKVGFKRYMIPNEPRPKDVHLVLSLKNTEKKQ